MDPKECLRLATAALARGDVEECQTHLANYDAWRHSGGFEPEHGDRTAQRLGLDCRGRTIRRAQAFRDTVQREHPMGAARIVRRERYAWPGGYPLVLVLHDGEVLCPDCVADNFSAISSSHRTQARDGWQPAGLEIVEAPECDVHCADCHERIAEGFAEERGE